MSAALLAELDEVAYWETWRLEQTWAIGGGNLLPGGFTERLFPERHAARVAYDNRVWAALMLSPTVEVARALLQGTHVPRHRLNPDYLHLLERWPS